MKHLAVILIFAVAGSAQTTPRTKTTAGILRKLSSKKIIIESADHRIIWYLIPDNVRLDRETARPGDHVSVTSTSDGAGHYTATSLEWISVGPDEDRAAAAQTWDLPDDDAAGGRRVRTSLPTRPEDQTIAKARLAAFNFVGTLPNFIAQQTTARYSKEGSRGGWQAVDVVSANLVYRDGREQYTNVQIGNKRVNQSIMELDGLHSTGEFATILRTLFDPYTGTEFRSSSRIEVHGRKVYVYKFKVPRERSEWCIAAPSEHYYTAYGGAVWIDAKTARVLRIEMQADLPKAFPLDTAETNVEYDFVPLDSGKEFLLPTESQALNCVRGTRRCMRNTTSFRDYAKFDAESRIIFDEPK